MEVRALQPQRELSPDVELLIGAKENCDVTVTAKIFADTLAEPTIQELNLKISVEQLTVKAADILQEIILPMTAKKSTNSSTSESTNSTSQGTRRKRQTP